MAMIDKLEALLAAGQDTALLRFGLGQAYLNDGQAAAAITHLREAVRHDPQYSAAWKLLGRALVENHEPAAAAEAYRAGIEAAEGRGDKQAAREMRVFLKRLSA